MADPLVLAYLAGVVDSDGCVTIHRSVRAGAVYHAARISIAGTRRAVHDLAAETWGGRVFVHIPKNPAHRPQFQWSLTGRRAVTPLLDLMPYLRLKQAQAQLALDLQENLAEATSDDPFPWFGPDFDPLAAREALRDEMTEVLNA